MALRQACPKDEIFSLNTLRCGMQMRASGWGVVLALALGCSQSPNVVINEMDPAQDQLLKIATAYHQVNLDRGTPPRSPAEIKSALASRGDGPEVLISPRDGKPFVIAWGTEIAQIEVDVENPTIMAYEKLGKDGRRFALMTAGNVQLLSDEQIAAARFAKGIGPH
jgi:hypothetical protein